ncbi:MAG: type II secretion system secretin GspD [Pseudomonadota bacterium]
MTTPHAAIPNPRAWPALLAALLILAAAGAPAPVHAEDEETWTINIQNAELSEFVAQVAEITGRTFVVDPRIQGNVTVISSTPMTTEGVYELFLSVLRVHNWTAVPSGGVIRIQQMQNAKQSPGAEGDLDEPAPEELVTRVISAQNTQSAELVKILRPLIPQYGHIAAVETPNVVIISDHADNIERLVRIIDQIDVADDEDVVVVPLEEAYVGNVVSMLEVMAPDQLGADASGPQTIQVVANERNNSLVLRGKPDPLGEILTLVEKLDKPATVTGGTQVIYLRFADAARVAELLEGMLTEAQEQAEDEAPRPETLVRADESLNAIVVRGDPGVMREVEDILDRLDIRRTQVLIEAAIVEISVTDTSEIGVEMAAVDESGDTAPLITTSLDGIISSLLGNIVGEDGEVDVLSGVAALDSPTAAAARIDAGDFSFGAVVRALATSSDANLLSTPSILTLDNQEAKIVVGNEVPFRTGTYTTTGEGAENPFTTIQREDVGLQLTVTPHIHEDKAVSLEVALEITNVTESPVGQDTFSDVVTSKRTVENTILADDRQTIVLGGLIQDDINDTVRKVPLLGDIPVLGRLFRSTSTDHTKRNLLVFLRPTVIRNKGDANQATDRKYDDVWKVEIRGRSGDVDPEELFEGRP